MKPKTTHNESLIHLRRIEGHVKGIQKMVDGGKYCIDIVTQIHAVARSLYKVSEKILAKHIEGCVVSAFRGGSKKERIIKIDEIMKVIRNMHKLS